MSKIKNYKYYSKIIDKIQNTRSKNNKNWMDLMRLSFKENPTETIKIVKGIFREDSKISKLIKNLTKS
jgi:transcription elongation factor GreA-like protein|tara:strand:+ start:771 stop:974 length:204 start_codon:yes stop_codon:yes gene_type:complete